MHDLTVLIKRAKLVKESGNDLRDLSGYGELQIVVSTSVKTLSGYDSPTVIGFICYERKITKTII